ncbi:type I-E CRISPR-associated protein Cse2/CasB [Ornithinimicrobium cavernae]|uniref:type I-E CRISPR-associated protein Cse2/CasB n=1 Tax=Ornithinimicrobium cavernae TaxID=2666047 RepID=UPI00137B2343|nr:type I-E CRISPR-associated protein Cse2/CasB [Ornithinimicrobium cavernae]
MRQHVTGVVLRVQGGYARQGRVAATSAAVQFLAELRRAIGAAGRADPRSWALVLDGLPDALSVPSHGSLSRPTRAERSIFTALTTYAIHQQGQRQPMHVAGVTLGQATRRLARQRVRGEGAGDLDEQVVQRLHRVSLAQTDELRAHALRGLVTLMKGAASPVALDYGRLAQDIYWLLTPSTAASVHLNWGRGLHSRFADERQDGINNPPETDTQTSTPGAPA